MSTCDQKRLVIEETLHVEKPVQQTAQVIQPRGCHLLKVSRPDYRLRIVVRLYEPAGKAASRGQRPSLRLRPAAEEAVPGADDDGDGRNGHVVDHNPFGTNRLSSKPSVARA